MGDTGELRTIAKQTIVPAGAIRAGLEVERPPLERGVPEKFPAAELGGEADLELPAFR